MSDEPPLDSPEETAPSRWARALLATGEGSVETFKELASSYWYCAYAWWRRAGLNATDATKATLASFSRWMEEASPKETDSGAERMREWMAARLAELAREEVELEVVDPTAVSIDAAWAEKRYADEPAGEAEAIFQRRWALTVIEFTAATLRGEYAQRGEEPLFNELLAFAGFGSGEEDQYSAAATRTRRSSGAMHKAVFDFRTRQREVLRTYAADTLLNAEDANSEITALLCALSAPGDGAEKAPLPTEIRQLRPEEVLARAMQTVRMTQVGPGGWSPPSLEEVARLFPQYEMISLIGRGAMGAVYKARQPELDRFIAVKLLPLEVSVDQDFAQRFRREAQTMAKLSHPNIIAVHKFGTTEEGHLFFAMEFVDGADLQQIIRGPGLAPLHALAIIGEMCDALAYAHGKGVVHRDIKPANVMVNVEGHAKMADFGLARLTNPTPEQAGHTATGALIGTVDYMAPEQMNGEAIDHRADIYSLGVTLYEMLCGEVPRGVFDPPSKRVVGVSAKIDPVVRKAMQQQPERRYQSTQEMKSDVIAATNALLAPRRGAPVQHPGLTHPPAASPKKSKAPLVIGAGAALAILAAAIGYLNKGEKSALAAVETPTPAVASDPKTPSATPPVAGDKEVAAAAPETAKSSPSASPPANSASAAEETTGAPAPAESEPKLSAPETRSMIGKWLAEQVPHWKAAYASEVQAPFEKDADDLKKRYQGAVAVQFELATRNQQLEAAVAYRAEQKLLTDGGDVPVGDQTNDLPALKALRAKYRKEFAGLDAKRIARAKAFYTRYDLQLEEAQTRLTKSGRLDEAMELKEKRQQLAAEWLEPPSTAAEPSASVLAATKDRPFVNTLGMKFVPVPILGGPTNRQRVFFGIWDTRVQDYELFVKETGTFWPAPSFTQEPTHPAVNVSWEDAQLFCKWLTAREHTANRLPAEWVYRLPSDYEFSCAVGIGDREDPAKSPAERNAKIDGTFPWGTEWPPPVGAGNYGGEELKEIVESGKFSYMKKVLTGYKDSFLYTSPVGSFAPNPLGLYDMGGNVFDWCEDWLDQSQKARVRRGAAWNYVSRIYLLSSCRESSEPTARGNSNLGFRCVLGMSAPSGANASLVQAAPASGNKDLPPIAKSTPAPVDKTAAADKANLPKMDIRGVRETRYIYKIAADGIWRPNWPCLRIVLRSSADLKAEDILGKAYFFDADRKLISQFDKIPEAEHLDGQYGMPPLLKARAEAEIFVPIDSKVKDAKWRSAVLVFGDPRNLEVILYPHHEGLSWKDFTFPERAALLAQGKDSDEVKK